MTKLENNDPKRVSSESKPSVFNSVAKDNPIYSIDVTAKSFYELEADEKSEKEDPVTDRMTYPSKENDKNSKDDKKDESSSEHYIDDQYHSDKS